MKEKISLRFTVVVWGEKYTELFLNFAIKSLFTEEAKLILKDNFYTEFAIYTDNDAKNYLKNLNKFNELTNFFDNIIFDEELLKDSINILDCFNIYSPNMSKSNHIFHQSLKHSLKKSYENNSYNILILPELLYSKYFLSNILSFIMKGKDLIIYHPLRISHDENIESYFFNILEKDGYIDENLIFNKIDNIRAYNDYFYSLKVGIPSNWKGYNYKFNDSQNIHIKAFNTLYGAINPKKFTDSNKDLIECYASDYWSLVDRSFKNSDNMACMSNLSEGCALDFEIKSDSYTDYKKLNKNFKPVNNKFLLYLKFFTTYFPYRVNSLFDYTYSVDIDKNKMDSELKFIQNSLKKLYFFRTYNTFYHYIRKYVQKIMNIYLRKRISTKLKNAIGKDVVLIGDGKFIVYLFKNMLLLKEINITGICILDYNNYHSNNTKFNGIRVIKVDELDNLNDKKVTYLEVNNKKVLKKDEKKITLFESNLEYNFIALIFKLFKLFLIRA